jgi:hypothetical protein
MAFSSLLSIQVVPKDAATMISLQKCVAGNVLFVHLEPDELNDVLDAMFLVCQNVAWSPDFSCINS